MRCCHTHIRLSCKLPKLAEGFVDGAVTGVVVFALPQSLGYIGSQCALPCRSDRRGGNRAQSIIVTTWSHRPCMRGERRQTGNRQERGQGGEESEDAGAQQREDKVTGDREVQGDRQERGQKGRGSWMKEHRGEMGEIKTAEDGA